MKCSHLVRWFFKCSSTKWLRRTVFFRLKMHNFILNWDQLSRLPVFTGGSELSLPIRSCSRTCKSADLQSFQPNSNSSNDAKWAAMCELKSTQCLSRRQTHVQEGRHYQSVSTSWCQIASLACLFSWRLSSTFTMRDNVYGELMLTTAHSLLFSQRPQRAGRFQHLRSLFKKDRRTRRDWGWKERSLASEFVHAYSWHYPSARKI